MDTRARAVVAAGLASLLGGPAWPRDVTMLAGGGSRRTDCLVEVATTGVPFPAGKTALGATCLDGDGCDLTSARNTCQFSVSICLNARDPVLGRCRPKSVTRVRVRQRGRKQPRIDVAAIQAAVDRLLPTSATQCTDPLAVVVPVVGPDKRGELKRGMVELGVKAKAKGGRVDQDRYQFVCVPGGVPSPPGGGGGGGTTPVVGTPGAGLKAQILGAAVASDGTVTADLKLTDDSDVPVTPVLGPTTDPETARVRLTIARLDVDNATEEGFVTPFTRYRSYVLVRQTAPSGAFSDQPAYDSTGSFAVLDPVAGVFRYTFGTRLPPGYPAGETHTVGAQIERTVHGEALVANPFYDFVPAGGAVTMVRELSTTSECNACHGTLAVHGGGRREVRLCQLCHTDQAVDPDTGNTIDFMVMIHKIHRGKELPSVEAAVGAKYSIIGFQRTEFVYGERVRFCKSGPRVLNACKSAADCAGFECVDADGTTIKTEGVGFPQDIRNCEKCHEEGATAADHHDRPSAAACASCHDDVNPGLIPTAAGPPGTKHPTAGGQPDAFCRLCHRPEGEEFGLSVEGGHTIPARASTLGGIKAAILAASGSAGGAVTIDFKVTDKNDSPINIQDPAVMPSGSIVRFQMSGPLTATGATPTEYAARPIAATAVGSGSSGTLTPSPGGSGVYRYETTVANGLPNNPAAGLVATGTWTVGLEIRRTVELLICAGGIKHGLSCTTDTDCPDSTCGQDVAEAAANALFDFKVGGGTPVPRRKIVDTASCGDCHGTFSKDFSVHGSLRNQVEFCVLCHNADATDFGRRKYAIGEGADPATESIHLKVLIHAIHTGEERERKPYVVYGRGGQPKNYTPHDFGDIRFPRDRRDCAACHLQTTMPRPSQLLPLADGLRPTLNSTVTGSGDSAVETVTGETPPIQAACLSCHDGDDAHIHAVTNTSTSTGAEACNVCHAEGRIAGVSAVH
jgi:OmcA/MtrC family decaheme c-type cytochrome